MCEECVSGKPKDIRFNCPSCNSYTSSLKNVNFTVLDLVEQRKKKTVEPYKKLCPRHPKKYVKFLARNNSPICSTCLQTTHQKRHGDLLPAEPYLK
jgi:hypothetical protein